MADYANFQPTDEWAKSNAGMSLADFYKANPSYQSGASGGGGTQAYDDVIKSLPKTADFASSLDTKENNAFGDYFKYISGQSSPLDFYSKASESMGLPQLRTTQKSLQGQIYDLEDSLRRVEPDVNATTTNSVVTEAQRRGMVQAKQQPIQEQLGWQSQSLGRVSSAISDLNSQALNLTQLNEQGVQRLSDAYKERLNLAVQQGSRSLQAFIHDTDQVLNVTLAKIARGEAVSDRDAQFAHELLAMQKQAELSTKGDGSLLTLSEGEAVYDPATGQIVYKNPKTSVGGGGSGGFDIGSGSTRSSVGF